MGYEMREDLDWLDVFVDESWISRQPLDLGLSNFNCIIVLYVITGIGFVYKFSEYEFI